MLMRRPSVVLAANGSGANMKLDLKDDLSRSPERRQLDERVVESLERRTLGLSLAHQFDLALAGLTVELHENIHGRLVPHQLRRGPGFHCFDERGQVLHCDPGFEVRLAGQ